jgi:hypothetical protein
LERARTGDVPDADFVNCIGTSLPYAWSVVARTAKALQDNGQPFAVCDDVPPTEQDWAQLFRLVASDAMRAAVERHFNVRLAFQNCCKVGLFRPSATSEYEDFTSVRAQILNQKPELINC